MCDAAEMKLATCSLQVMTIMLSMLFLRFVAPAMAQSWDAYQLVLAWAVTAKVL